MSKIVCWWSGGVTSAIACRTVINDYGLRNCKIIFLDTQNEHDDTYRFKKDCEEWYGGHIQSLRSDKYKNIQETWFKHLSLNTANGAICSYMLKRRVREKWEKENEYAHQVFGFEYDKKEINRAKALELNHPHTRPLFPLIKYRISKKECFEVLKAANIKPPESYLLGFRNNNCLNTGCVQGGIGYWKKIQKEMPNIFDKMAQTEHDLTNLKKAPVTMLKDQSKKAKESGAKLVFLKKNPDYPDHKCLDDMKGRPVKPLSECNGFCGVNDLVEKNDTESEINWGESQ